MLYEAGGAIAIAKSSRYRSAPESILDASGDGCLQLTVFWGYVQSLVPGGAGHVLKGATRQMSVPTIPSRSWMSATRVNVVAELAASHGGSLNRALELLEIAKVCGADAVKIQTYSPLSMTLPSRSEEFRLPPGSPWSEYETQWELFSAGAWPEEWYPYLFRRAAELDIILFSSPFSEDDIALLERYECPAYKIASPEINYMQLIQRAAQTGKPIILSSGVASIEELKTAIAWVKATSGSEITVLKCTSCYPAPLLEQDLLSIAHLRRVLEVAIGFSDHTVSVVSGAVAVGLGATMLEKHLADGSGAGLESGYALDPQQFADYVRFVREAESLLGETQYRIAPSAVQARDAMRSIRFARDLRAGDIIVEADLAIVRPNGGAHPREYECMIGKTLSEDVSMGTPADDSRFLGDT